MYTVVGAAKVTWHVRKQFNVSSSEMQVHANGVSDSDNDSQLFWDVPSYVGRLESALSFVRLTI